MLVRHSHIHIYNTNVIKWMNMLCKHDLLMCARHTRYIKHYILQRFVREIIPAALPHTDIIDNVLFRIRSVADYATDSIIKSFYVPTLLPLYRW
jgi:hypothetical protein